MAWAGGPCGRHEPTRLPALLISRLWFNSRMSSCQVECLRTATVRCDSRQPHQVLTGCASARGRVSKTQLTPGGTEAVCHFRWGRGRQVMRLPCKQVDVGALPTDSTISLRETRPMYREKPHK